VSPGDARTSSESGVTVLCDHDVVQDALTCADDAVYETEVALLHKAMDTAVSQLADARRCILRKLHPSVLSDFPMRSVICV